MEQQGLKAAYWRQAQNIDGVMKLPDLLDALAVFVSESRIKHDGLGNAAQSNANRREANPAWVKDYRISLHSSIICWEPDGKDSRATDQLVQRHAVCSLEWRGEEGNWRRDFVWVQEFGLGDQTYTAHHLEVLQGRLLGQLQLIVTVLDPTRPDAHARGKAARYTGALVKLFQWRHRGGCMRPMACLKWQGSPLAIQCTPERWGH